MPSLLLPLTAVSLPMGIPRLSKPGNGRHYNIKEPKLPPIAYLNGQRPSLRSTKLHLAGQTFVASH